MQIQEIERLPGKKMNLKGDVSKLSNAIWLHFSAN
jgi:hypothetical protein